MTREYLIEEGDKLYQVLLVVVVCGLLLCTTAIITLSKLWLK